MTGALHAVSRPGYYSTVLEVEFGVTAPRPRATYTMTKLQKQAAG